MLPKKNNAKKLQQIITDKDIIYNLLWQMIQIQLMVRYKDSNQFISLFNNTNKRLNNKNKDYNINNKVHKLLLKDLLLQIQIHNLALVHMV